MSCDSSSSGMRSSPSIPLERLLFATEIVVFGLENWPGQCTGSRMWNLELSDLVLLTCVFYMPVRDSRKPFNSNSAIMIQGNCVSYLDEYKRRFRTLCVVLLGESKRFRLRSREAIELTSSTFLIIRSRRNCRRPSNKSSIQKNPPKSL